MFFITKSCKSAFASIAATALLALATPAGAATNVAPTISGSPKTSTLSNLDYAFKPGAYDANGDTLKFSITGKPSWASFTTATGKLYGKPTASGRFSNIVISVSDGRVKRSLPAFSINVTANKAPTISGRPGSSVAAGSAYAFTPTASDADHLPKPLAFSIANKPAWASFSTTTGRLSGKPTSVGTFSNISIKVTDGWKGVSLPAFSIKVLSENRAPVISGNPATSATVGQPYAFKPVASDIDGNALSFAIVNKPSWIVFERVTGVFYGTPSSNDIGTLHGVVITVSDGKATASLPAFSITVAVAQTRSATLGWTPPTQNVDGTPITDLAGYVVSYGTSPSSYAVSLPINGAGITSVTIEDLEPGMHYFAIKAVNAAGAVSEFSNEASKLL
ncbi:MAG: fibronectin type III domain-containing protein [Proteobacteria bacterium]|nr:fibronectin type III domain-containing protein [Pseudomonadota bacterium]